MISFILSIISFIGYWIILPIILWILIKILLLVVGFSSWRENKNYAPTRGYRGRWW